MRTLPILVVDPASALCGTRVGNALRRCMGGCIDLSMHAVVRSGTDDVRHAEQKQDAHDRFE